jgi:hypothetical protein
MRGLMKSPKRDQIRVRAIMFAIDS